MKYLTIDPKSSQAPTRDLPPDKSLPSDLPDAKEIKLHPSTAKGGKQEDHNASLFFVGTATTILEWEGLRVMTDPNFLHAGDHVHLGPGVTGTRQTNPAVDLHDLPNIHLILLSHYHADHFDQDVEASLRRDMPIITTPHAKSSLTSKGEGEDFESIYDLDFWDSMFVNIASGSEPSSSEIPRIQVTGMPGKHVPPGVLGTMNDLLGAVPPTNGWMIELGYGRAPDDHYKGDFECSYRIYISGDTLLVDDLQSIPTHYANKPIDLMLIHLGGTTIPSTSLPLLMVTMDAKQGVELVKLIHPDLTIPIHYDDYDLFLSPLSDFKAEMEKAGWGDKVVYLDRGDQFQFQVRKELGWKAAVATGSLRS